MTRPALNLPSLAAPWGRWVQDRQDENMAALARQQSDSNSAGSVFAGRADLIQQQISSIPSVSAVYQREIPPFSVTRGPTGAIRYVYDSSTQVFNPPSPNKPYGFTVIACMNVSGVPGAFAYSLLRVNGEEFLYRHENRYPSGGGPMVFSILGNGDVPAGGAVSVNFAVASAGSGTANFAPTQLYCAFSGSIL